MADESPESPQRWTAKRRVALVVSVLKGETSVAAAARKHGLTVAEVEEWRERFLLGAENASRTRPRDEEALKDEQIKRLKPEDRRSGIGPRHPEGGRDGIPTSGSPTCRNTGTCPSTLPSYRRGSCYPASRQEGQRFLDQISERGQKLCATGAIQCTVVAA
jgi:transposase-like protein